jgi:hypothetical protein
MTSQPAPTSLPVDGKTATTLLGTLRIAIGVGAWAAPELAARAFAPGRPSTAQAPFLVRIYGVRDVVIGAGMLASEGEARRNWLAGGVVCDAADALAALLGSRAGHLPSPVAALVALPALGGVALGVIALRDGQDEAAG